MEEETLDIKLGDYFGGDLDVRAKVRFKDLVKKLDPSFKIDDKNITFKSEPQEIAGRYFMIKGYGFRESAWGYECLITPEDSFDRIMKDAKEDINTFCIKAKGDRGKNYFTRFKSSTGGKLDFNPVSKTGGVESIEDTRRRIG